MQAQLLNGSNVGTLSQQYLAVSITESQQYLLVSNTHLALSSSKYH